MANAFSVARALDGVSQGCRDAPTTGLALVNAFGVNMFSQRFGVHIGYASVKAFDVDIEYASVNASAFTSNRLRFRRGAEGLRCGPRGEAVRDRRTSAQGHARSHSAARRLLALTVSFARACSRQYR